MIKQALLKYNRNVAIFDGDQVICKKQIESAVIRANRSQKNNCMVAKIWGIEVLLQLVGTHQINLAIDLLDIKETTKLIICIAEELIVKDKSVKIITGLPEFTITDKLVKSYQLFSDDYCKEVISKAVLFTTDYE